MIEKLPANLVPVSCNRDCGGGCPLVMEFSRGSPRRIMDNPLRPDSEIRGCSRGYRALEAARSPERLKTPLKRKGARGGTDFETLSWEQALDEIAGKLIELKAALGPEALMVLPGSGSCRGSVHSTSGLTRRFFSLWGRTTTTRGYYSNTAAHYASRSVFGMKGPGQDPRTLEKAGLVVLWGANICDLRFGARLEPALRKLKADGIPIYVIDPRLTRTGRILAGGSQETISSPESHWLAVNPGSDTALMAALIYYLISDYMIDRNFLTEYTFGFESLEEWVMGKSDGQPKTPEWAAGICGIPVEQIKTFARIYATSRPTALIPGLSIQRGRGGEEAYRMAMALQAAAGSTGVSGGSSGGCLWDTMPGPLVGSLGEIHPDDKIQDTFSPLTVPVNNWQDAVIEGKSGGWPSDIAGIYGVGNNYLVQSSDMMKTVTAFRRARFSVCHDLFPTATARHSDYILPATHFLERDDILSTCENYLYYSHKVLEPPGEARDDYDIFLELAARLGIRESFGMGRSSEEWIRICLERSDVNDPASFMESGIFDGGEHERIALSGFISNPELEPLDTPSGRIHLLCEENGEFGFPEHPHHREEVNSSGYPFRMVTPHGRHRVNSQNSNLDWFREREYPLVYMNPSDAAEREFTDGMDVLLVSSRGCVRLPLCISGEVRPGVIWALQGNWEEEHSVNSLTSTRGTLPSRGSVTHSVFADVRSAD